ncbi:MAG: hypothetical protein ACFFDT_10120 [Candidatus Hodarchaeota archaeon]
MIALKKFFIGIMLLSSVTSIILIGVYSLNLKNDSTPPTHPQILLDESEFNNAIRDEFTFINVTLEHDLLYLEVSYSGGCATHDFSLIGTGVFMESYPVQTSIVLSHEDNNDNCESIVTETLMFDLTPLKELYTESYLESSGTIIIYLLGYAKLSHLYGWENLISYEF